MELHNKLLACAAVLVNGYKICITKLYAHQFAGNGGSISTHSIISTSTVECVPPSFSAAVIVMIVVGGGVVRDIIIMIIIFVLLLRVWAPALLLNAHIFLWLFARIQFVMMNFLPLSAFFLSFLFLSSSLCCSSLSSHSCGLVCGNTTLFIRRFCLGFTTQMSTNARHKNSPHKTMRHTHAFNRFTDLLDFIISPRVELCGRIYGA